MPAIILDGKMLAARLRANLKKLIQQDVDQDKQPPGLAVILVGSDPASEIYVENKRKACKEVGIRSFKFDLPNDVSEQQLLTLIHELNSNPNIHGILIQLPLPQHINTQAVIEAVDPKKDVDGFHPYNLGRLVQQLPTIRPCTPQGIITLLNHYQINLNGLNAVIVGTSNIVGKPLAFELLQQKCTVTLCNSATLNLAFHVKNAELLVVAIGNPHVIQTEWLKSNAIVVDVGMNRLADGKVVGDIDFESAKYKVAAITPVPGGVGPMTVISLLQNTFNSSKTT